jgi:predicted LPLAT superfamily acyltransferase
VKQKVKESDIQRSIIEWLSYQRIFHYRNNSGGFKDANQHFYRFGATGSPDIVCVIEGRYVGIEVKASDGRQSDAQRDFQARLEAAGGLYILAKSIDDVERSLKPQLKRAA